MRIEDLIKIRIELSKAKFGSKKMDITPNPCWEGYEPIGLKDDGSPNCVPIKASKESFVIPMPDKGESQDAYVSRCMGVIGKENKPQDQLIAMCIGTYQNK